MLDILSALFESVVSALQFVAGIIPFLVNLFNYIKSMFGLFPSFATPYVLVAFAICIFLGIKRAVLF